MANSYWACVSRRAPRTWVKISCNLGGRTSPMGKVPLKAVCNACWWACRSLRSICKAVVCATAPFKRLANNLFCNSTVSCNMSYSFSISASCLLRLSFNPLMLSMSRFIALWFSWTWVTDALIRPLCKRVADSKRSWFLMMRSAVALVCWTKSIINVAIFARSLCLAKPNSPFPIDETKSNGASRRWRVKECTPSIISLILTIICLMSLTSLLCCRSNFSKTVL